MRFRGKSRFAFIPKRSIGSFLIVTRNMLQVFKIKMRGYIPDFKLAFEHFCIHTGGRGVIDEIEKQLELTPSHTQPSKEALFRYGNVSSSSVW